MAKIGNIQEVAVSELVPYERNAKTHSPEQVQKLVASIKEFGFISPCLIDKDNNIIAGHGRVMAAKEIGMNTVPCVFVEGLTETQKRAYILADNKLTELGGWDYELVDLELAEIQAEGFEIELTGFDSIGEPDYSDLFVDSEDKKEKKPKQIKCPHCGEMIDV